MPHAKGVIRAARRKLLLYCLGSTLPVACGGSGQTATDAAPVPGSGGGSGSGGSRWGVDGAGTGGVDGGSTQINLCEAPSSGNTDFALRGAPLLFNPTANGFGINAVLATGDPCLLRARVRSASTEWTGLLTPQSRTADLAEWHFDGLLPGTVYSYELWDAAAAMTEPLYAGHATTQRLPGDPFLFILISDSHIGADLSYSNQGDPDVLKAVSAEVASDAPDFVINLGDMVDFHQFGFNDPPPDGSYTRLAYLNYRSLLGDALGGGAHFAAIGNWEGENGCYPADAISWSRQQRFLYIPGPTPTTYLESGSPNQDYYAFTWGDALLVVLNVMTYTPTPHLLGTDPGLPDDWTLGEAQLQWLATTLANATSKWRFLFIHHTVGGAAGDDINSAYGRGGGQAAYVGEQAKVHALMRQYGVQVFFYGHDHVFTDMVVDGIHYSEPGSAGAIWLFTQDETGYTQSWQKSGYSRVTIGPSSMRVQFMGVGEPGPLYQYELP